MKTRIESFENLVEALERLPAVGKKSARRMAYYMTMEDHFAAMKIAHAIEDAVRKVGRCERCGAMSEDELCPICSDETRDGSKLCLVEHPSDVVYIENSGEYDGLYFVVDNTESLDTRRLKEMIEKEGVEEVIFAFTPGIASDALMLYIEERLKDLPLLFTRIAQGIPTGVNLENVDTLSLSRALQDRTRL